MKPMISLSLLLLSAAALAGGFDEYIWRSSFQSGGGYYQPTLKITYVYLSDGKLNPSVLALPRDPNLHLMEMSVSVDGQKVEAEQGYATTWWSDGEEVPVFMPPSGNKIEAEAFYIIKNLFLIPPAPTDFAVPCKSLEVGFAALAKFTYAGTFSGPQQKFKDRHITAKEGNPTTMKFYELKDLPANQGRQGLFFLVPKSFTFSFNLLRGAEQTSSTQAQTVGGPAVAGNVLGGIGTQAGTPGGGDADINTGDLKTYSMIFYTQKKERDWQFAPTWLQQDYTYLPHGILPGGRVKSRSLFNGAGEKTDDLIAWVDPAGSNKSDAAPASKDPAPYQAIDLFLSDFRKSVQIDPEQSRFITSETNGMISPALANKQFATQVAQRFGLKVVPALSTRVDAKTAPSMPLSAFHGIITAIQIQNRWFLIDAATDGWELRTAGEYLKGQNVVILDDKLQMASF